MNLVKDNWTKDDIKPFLDYLNQFKREEKIDWTRNIINTNMKVLAILSKDIKSIIKEIGKGNFISFLDLEIDDSYESLLISGGLLSKIKDFDIYKEYLLRYSKKIDNWALCDTYCNSIKIVKKYEEKYFKEALKMSLNKDEFISRIGLIMILSHFINKKNLDKIFNTLNKINSNKYYINMAEAWLLCELFIKYKEETLKYFETHNLNKFTINKTISKIHDSYRVSYEDKEYINKYKVRD